MTVKVNYDPDTGLVKGYYPSSINYPSIPTPFIEIGDIEHSKISGRKMCINNGSLQEYVNLSEELKEAKKQKLVRLAENRHSLAENSTVSYSGNSFANSQNARIAILRYITSMTASSTAVSYFTFPERGIVPLVKADFQALATLIEENETALRTAEVSLIQEINACTTVEAVNAIDISLT